MFRSPKPCPVSHAAAQPYRLSAILSVTDGEDGRRYRMQETVRAYGLMRPAGERHPTQRRHRDHYRRVAARANDEWFGPDQLAWFARLRAEHANMRAAMEFCLTEPGEEGVGLALAADLWPLWIAGGYLSEGRRWLSRALTLSPESAPARATALGVCLGGGPAGGHLPGAGAARRVPGLSRAVRRHGCTRLRRLGGRAGRPDPG